MLEPVDFNWSLVTTSTSGGAMNPHLIHQASDIPAGRELVYQSSGTLTLGARTRPVFDFHWLREITVGVLGGSLGVQADSSTEATVDYRLEGQWHAVISLDTDQRLRLRIQKSQDSSLQFAAQVAAEAQTTAPSPDQTDPLAAAILGVHDQQWLSQLAGVGPELGRFLEAWRSMDSAGAAVIWRATGAGDEMSRLQAWVHRIATELGEMPAFAEAVRESIETDASFAFSTAALWTEAEAGSLLAATLDPVRFQKLLQAAGAAGALLADQSLLGVLGQLKQQAATHLTDSSDEWVRKQLSNSVGVDSARRVRDAICQQLGAALGSKLTAELRWTYDLADQSSALIDASFDFTAEGQRAYQDALAGRWSRVLGPPSEHVRVRQGMLTHGLRREAHLELHLPFLERKQWNTRLEALAKVEVAAGEDGRLLVYEVDAADRISHEGMYQSALMLGGGRLVGRAQPESYFTLSYTDQRSRTPGEALAALPAITAAYGFDPGVMEWLRAAVAAAEAQVVETWMTLAVPGDVVSGWLETPGERDADFFAVFSQVSMAVQTAMRRWLPYAYFQDLGHYETLGAAFPLLVYQYSRPYGGQPRSNFSYDAMSEESMAQVRRTATRGLREALGGIQRLLEAAGRKSTAEFYAAGQAQSMAASVGRSPRQLQSLIVADAFFMDALVKLAVTGGQIAAAMPTDPQGAVRMLTRFSAEFVRTFHMRLRRLYAGQDFVAFGSLLLVEATNALGKAQGRRTAIRGILRLKVGDREQTFVNADYGR